jgi:hypothetical protein
MTIIVQCDAMQTHYDITDKNNNASFEYIELDAIY